MVLFACSVCLITSVITTVSVMASSNEPGMKDGFDWDDFVDDATMKDRSVLHSNRVAACETVSVSSNAAESKFTFK